MREELCIGPHARRWQWQLEGYRERVGDINIIINILVVVCCCSKEGGEEARAVEPRQMLLRKCSYEANDRRGGHGGRGRGRGGYCGKPQYGGRGGGGRGRKGEGEKRRPRWEFLLRRPSGQLVVRLASSRRREWRSAEWKGRDRPVVSTRRHAAAGSWWWRAARQRAARRWRLWIFVLRRSRWQLVASRRGAAWWRASRWRDERRPSERAKL